MKKKQRLIIFLLLFLFHFGYSQVERVDLLKKDGRWTLELNEKEYYIKGAGGQTHLALLKTLGGNTIRTWSAENAEAILDEAEANGLKVMLGLWVQHERHGFDYNNEENVQLQLEKFRRIIEKHKNHPALLIWCVGNEYELAYSNAKVWKAVNEIAEMIQKVDDMHPVATVTAGVSSDKIKYVMNELTAVDIYGINTYGDISKVKQVLEKANFQKPYMITEWGPTGHWESPKTDWGVALEQTSTEKATIYLDRYQKYIEADKEQCLGSFTFLWGQKQEYTKSWYGLFTENGQPTEVMDQLAFLWSGQYPENRSPTNIIIRSNSQKKLSNLRLKAGKTYKFKVNVKDLDNDKLYYSWALYKESTDKKIGGDRERKPKLMSSAIQKPNKPKIRLKLPKEKGAYRLFVDVSDTKKVAYMNIPIYIE